MTLQNFTRQRASWIWVWHPVQSSCISIRELGSWKPNSAPSFFRKFWPCRFWSYRTWPTAESILWIHLNLNIPPSIFHPVSWRSTENAVSRCTWIPHLKRLLELQDSFSFSRKMNESRYQPQSRKLNLILAWIPQSLLQLRLIQHRFSCTTKDHSQ